MLSFVFPLLNICNIDDGVQFKAQWEVVPWIDLKCFPVRVWIAVLVRSVRVHDIHHHIPYPIWHLFPNSLLLPSTVSCTSKSHLREIKPRKSRSHARETASLALNIWRGWQGGISPIERDLPRTLLSFDSLFFSRNGINVILPCSDEWTILDAVTIVLMGTPTKPFLLD